MVNLKNTLLFYMPPLICWSIEEFNQALNQCDRLIIGYTRVSTDLVTQDTSIERQIKDLTDAGCTIIAVERESGTKVERRKLYLAIIDLIESGRPEKIMSPNNLRLNRNAVEMNFFYNLCLQNNIPWNFLYEPELNSDSPYGKKLRWERAVKAQEESLNIGLRVRRSNIRNEKDRKVISKNPPFGYRIVNGKYEIDYVKEDLSNVVGFDNDTPYANGELARLAINLYLKYRTFNQGLKHYKIFLEKLKVYNQKLYDKACKSSLHWYVNWIKNPVLKGHLVYGRYKIKYYGEKLEKCKYVLAPPTEWRIYENQHSELINSIEANIINRIIDSNKNKGFAAIRTKQQKLNLPETLSFIKCKHCLKRYTAHTNGKGYRTYYCHGKTFNKTCKSSGISELKLQEILISEIINQSTKFAELLDNSVSGIITPDTEKLNQLKKSLQVAEQQELLTTSTAFRNAKIQLQAEIAELEAREKQEIANLKDRQDLIKGLSDPEFWQSLSKADLHRYLNDVVKLAWLDNKAIYRLDLDL